MNLSDAQINNLLKNSQYEDVIKNLCEIVKTDNATFNNYYAFIEAVVSFLDTKNYPLAYNCFIKANFLENKNSENLKKLYKKAETIIKYLGFNYFNDNNTYKIQRDFYLRARFMLYMYATKYQNALDTLSVMIKENPSSENFYIRSKFYIMQNKYKFA
ncbi:hypothetical protein IJG14_04615, partial [bacterium]|nr:hypothetical protein [bacterium]